MSARGLLLAGLICRMIVRIALLRTSVLLGLSFSFVTSSTLGALLPRVIHFVYLWLAARPDLIAILIGSLPTRSDTGSVGCFGSCRCSLCCGCCCGCIPRIEGVFGWVS